MSEQIIGIQLSTNFREQLWL